MSNHEHELIITIVNRGYADDVMEAAKTAGARGGTIVYGRGAGVTEGQKFFGIEIQPEKELILILVTRDARSNVMKAITSGAGLTSEGRGLTFSLPVDDVAGVTSMMRLDD